MAEDTLHLQVVLSHTPFKTLSHLHTKRVLLVGRHDLRVSCLLALVQALTPLPALYTSNCIQPQCLLIVSKLRAVQKKHFGHTIIIIPVEIDASELHS